MHLHQVHLHTAPIHLPLILSLPPAYHMTPYSRVMLTLHGLLPAQISPLPGRRRLQVASRGVPLRRSRGGWFLESRGQRICSSSSNRGNEGTKVKRGGRSDTGCSTCRSASRSNMSAGRRGESTRVGNLQAHQQQQQKQEQQQQVRQVKLQAPPRSSSCRHRPEHPQLPPRVQLPLNLRLPTDAPLGWERGTPRSRRRHWRSSRCQLAAVPGSWRGQLSRGGRQEARQR